MHDVYTCIYIIMYIVTGRQYTSSPDCTKMYIVAEWTPTEGPLKTLGTIHYTVPYSQEQFVRGSVPNCTVHDVRDTGTPRAAVPLVYIFPPDS